MNKEYEYDFKLTNENKKALEILRKEYGVHWFKMQLEDGTSLDLVEKIEYDLLQQENKQLKEIINKIKELMDKDQCAEYCYMDVAEYLLELEEGDK